MANPYPGLPTYQDPFKRSMWANYVIELAKLCPAYSHILELDPINTYKDARQSTGVSISTSGCSVVSINDDCPLISVVATISGQSATGEYNGVAFIADIKDGVMNINGLELRVHPDTDQCSVYIVNPYLVDGLPSKRIVRSMMGIIPNDISTLLDLDRPQDLACAFCLGLLYKYR